MKKQIKAKKQNLWRDVLAWLRLAAKALRKRFAVKGKSSQLFPNEAPH